MRVVPAVLLLDLPKDAIPGLRRVFDVRARQGNKWGVPQLERRAPVRRRCGVARPQYALPCRCFVLERAPRRVVRRLLAVEFVVHKSEARAVWGNAGGLIFI